MDVLDKSLEQLVSSMGVTACDAEALDALRSVAQAEADRVLGTASEISLVLNQSAIHPDAVRLACNSHMLMQPPVRERMLEVARAHNSRAQAWPLGAAVVVPTHQAAAAAYISAGTVIEDGAHGRPAPGSGVAVANYGDVSLAASTDHDLHRPPGALPEAPLIAPVKLSGSRKAGGAAGARTRRGTGTGAGASSAAAAFEEPIL